MDIEFIYCHGSQNYFIMIDETPGVIFQKDTQRVNFVLLLTKLASCRPIDGVLFLQVSKDSGCDYAMRMFNPDGSEAEMCGNGLRCIGRLAFEKSKKIKFFIEMLGKRFLVKKEQPISKGVETFSIKIDNVIISANDLPIKTKLPKIIFEKIPELSNKHFFTAAGMPNPHLISFVKNQSLMEMQKDLIELGEKILSLKDLFPEGINVSLCQKIDQESIFVQTYERGVGITNSCGTAMCSSAVSLTLFEPKLLEKPILVYNHGGLVECLVKKNQGELDVTLLGNATFTLSGKINYQAQKSILTTEIINTNVTEIDAYQRFVDSIALIKNKKLTA